MEGSIFSFKKIISQPTKNPPPPKEIKFVHVLTDLGHIWAPFMAFFTYLVDFGHEALADTASFKKNYTFFE